MESDITRLLFDSFASDGDDINENLKMRAYRRACIETTVYFREKKINPTPIEQANYMLKVYNRELNGNKKDSR